MGHVHHTLFIRNGIKEGVALEVSAAGEVVVIELLGVLAQLDMDLHLGGLGDDEVLGLSALEDQSGVDRGDLAVAVHVGNLSVEGSILSQLAGEGVEDRLCVKRIGRAVFVDVGLDREGLAEGLTVDLIGDVIGGKRLAVAFDHQLVEQDGAGVLQQAVTSVAGNVLREQVGSQGEFLALFQRIDREREVIATGAIGIVAQLSLDLAVLGGVGEEGGVLVHEDVGLGAHSVAHVGKTGADTDDGPILIIFVEHGMRGGHQQGVGELTGSQAGLLGQAAFADVLAHDAGHAVDLRRSHGGAGHQLVLVVTAGEAAGGVVVTKDGIDRAAGGQDLGLHNQSAGHAEGGEGGHIDGIGDLGDEDLKIGADGHGAGVVQHVASFILDRLGVSLDGVAVGLQDGDSRRMVGIVGEVHADGAGSVVDDDHRHSALRHSRVGLGKEGGGAAVADRNLAGDDFGAQSEEGVASLADVVVVVHAGAVNEDVLVLLAVVGNACHGVVAIAGGFGVEHMPIAKQQRHTGLTNVVDGSNRQGVGEGAGAAAGGEVVVVDVEVGVRHLAVVGRVIPHTTVAGGEGADHAAGDELVHHGLILAGEAEAGGAGAQRQVGGVATQDDGVLNGSHVVGVVRAAAGAEDLHGNDLGVGGNTLRTNSLERGLEFIAHLDEPVCSRNALDVRAVLALGIILVGDVEVGVNVVVRVADLGAQMGLRAGGDVGIELILDRVDALCGQQIQRGDVSVVAHALGLGVLLEGVFQTLSREGLVVLVDAGVDDGNLAAGAGVTSGPGQVGADHVRGGAVFGLVRNRSSRRLTDGGLRQILQIFLGLIAVLQEDVLHAVDTLDGVDLAVKHVCGDDVGSQGQVPLDVQLAADRLLDLGGHGRLIGTKTGTVVLGSGIVGDPLQSEAGFNSRSLLELDGNTDKIRKLVGFRLDGVIGIAVELPRLQCTGVNRRQGQLFEVRSCLGLLGTDCGDHGGEQHSQNQHNRQNALVHACVFHSVSPFQSIISYALSSPLRAQYSISRDIRLFSRYPPIYCIF